MKAGGEVFDVEKGHGALGVCPLNGQSGRINRFIEALTACRVLAVHAVFFAAGAEGDGNGKAVSGMFFLNLVDEVVLVGLDDEVFVVHEEDILGDRDGLVAVVDGGGAVEELEALAVALVLWWRDFDEGILKEAVERSGANDGLGVVADAGDGSEDVLDGLSLHGGDADEGGVVEEEKFFANVFAGHFDTGAFLSLGMVKVEFVGNDQAGFFLFLNHACDFAILGGHSDGEVNDEEADVGAADGAFAAHGGEDLDGVFHAGAFAEAGGVDDVVFFIAPNVWDVDGVAGGAGDGRDHGTLVFENGVDEGGLSGVGFADDRDFEAVFEFFFVGGFELAGFKFGEFFFDGIQKFGHAPAVFGGGGESHSKAEAGEVVGGVVVIGAVGFIHHEDDIGLGFAEELGDFLVDGVEPGAGVDDENDGIRGIHGNAGFHGNLIGKSVLVIGADSAGIDDFAGSLGEAARCGNAVPGDPGHVVHNGDASSGQTIKEGGLPDIGASDDSDLEWTGWHGLNWVLRLTFPKEQGLGGLDEDGNAARLQGVGRRAFEVIEDKLVPMVAG